jgi:acetoin utilization deacetylase AcuC-like enzyme
MRAFHSDEFVLPLPPGHTFPMPKYRLLREAVQASLPQVRLHRGAARPATANSRWPTSRDGSRAVAEGTLSAAQQREIGFPWSERMVARSRRSVGATIQAARAALVAGEGVAANLAGGTHHAYATRARATASSTTWRWPRG